MAKESLNLSAGVMHPREDLFIAGNLASGGELVVATDGAPTVSIDLRGTFSLTVELQGTIDGVNWVLIPVRSLLGGPYLAAIAGAVAGSWVGDCAAYRKVRARVSAFTSGSAAATLSASTARLDQSIQGAVAPLAVTATGASGAAVTLSLPSPGAGLRQYLTGLTIERFAVALLTAGAAPVVITTTGLPGSLAFSCPADAAAQGTIYKVIDRDFASPLVATAQAAAMTFVCPATTNVIWRATGFYRVGA